MFALPRRLLARLFLFAAILALDHMLLGMIPHSVPILGSMASYAIVPFAVFLGLGYSKLKRLEEKLPFNVLLFGTHLLCILMVCVGRLADLPGFGGSVNSVAGQVAAGVLLVLGSGLLAVACIPPKAWMVAFRITNPSWLLACLAGLCTWYLRDPFQSFWDASGNDHGSFLQILTFRAVHTVLGFFMPGLVFDPNTFLIGTPNFPVIIAKECSGMEGLGMVLVFTIIWLSYFRKESRFPQALLLVPCALVCMWVLNVVRICALILIGNAGAPDVAIFGFHSRAGWIAFTLVALAFSMATRKLAWVQRLPAAAGVSPGGSMLAGMGKRIGDADVPGEEAGESPATRAYLVPFLAILAASFVSKSASGYFEWLYPLRFVAAAVAIWFSRGELKKLSWRFSWAAPLAGAAVFLVWMAPAWWAKEPAASQLGPALAALSPLSRLTWIAFRVAAALITVPIAEELAFRGYLARRVINRDFDEVPFRNLTWLSIGVSSLVFGMLYGQHWIAGVLAGLVYAAVLKWKGRLGDAVVAHATTNLLLTAWVLLRGDWGQW